MATGGLCVCVCVCTCMKAGSTHQKTAHPRLESMYTSVSCGNVWM